MREHAAMPGAVLALLVLGLPGRAQAQSRPEQTDAPSSVKPVARAAARTFTSQTAPRWIVAETAPVAAPNAAPRTPPRGWRPQKRWAVAPVIGTDGAGAELSFLATRSLVFRARGNWLSARRSQTYDGVHYDGRLKFMTGGLFVDMHPLPGLAHPLFVSGGLIRGARKASVFATQGSVTYNGHVYTAAQIGTVSGDIRLPDTAPFVGLGFDNTYDTEGGFGFKLLAGVAGSSRPGVSLKSNGGLLSTSPALAADLTAEEAKIKAAAGYLRYYPVVSTGISYKF